MSVAWFTRTPGLADDISTLLLVMHIGSLIRSKVAERGISIVSFAEQLSCTRVNVYKIFDRKSIDTELLLRVSRVLDFDFFRYYSNDLIPPVTDKTEYDSGTPKVYNTDIHV